MAEVLSRRYAQWEKQAERSPYDADRDASFAALPNLVVIDGGKGQLARRPRAAAGLPRARRRRRLAGQADRGGLPARASATPLVLPHDTPELQLLQRVRDEAHRFAITHHRIRRDKAMTESIMDELPGIGPARKRALLKHFGSPEAVLGASREDARGRARRSRRRSRATSTPTSTRRADERWATRCATATAHAPPGSNLEDLVVISGLSGAGKSSAMNVFEDAGYFCVDNLPAEMIRSLAELFMHDGLEGRARRGRLRLARRRVPRGAGAA